MALPSPVPPPPVAASLGGGWVEATEGVPLNHFELGAPSSSHQQPLSVSPATHSVTSTPVGTATCPLIIVSHKPGTEIKSHKKPTRVTELPRWSQGMQRLTLD